MRWKPLPAILTLSFLALSVDSLAQGTLCGAARDPLGAELPGVESFREIRPQS